MTDEDLSQLIRQKATRYAASPELRSAVRARIAVCSASGDDGSAQDSRHPSVRDRQRRFLGWGRPRWGAVMPGWQGCTLIGAGFAAGVAASLVMVNALHGPSAGPAGTPIAMAPNLSGHAGASDTLRAELVADHVRSIQAGPLYQVASADRDTVKPWFQGKIDYAPPVLELSHDGFALLGGRVERVQGQAVAVLIYEYRQHIINLFVWPSDRRQPAQFSQERGFNLAHWSNGSMQCWVVTDMDRPDLHRFSVAWHDALPAG